MAIETLLLFFAAALFAEILGTIGGFGSSAFFVPLAGFFYDFEAVLIITGILHIFSNISKLILFGKTIDYKILIWLGVPSLLFAILGAELTSHVKLFIPQFALGAFLVILSCFLFFIPKAKLSQNKITMTTAGGLSGFLAGFLGTGGVIRGLSLAAFDLSKETFIATSAGIDLGVDLFRSGIYLKNDFLEKENYFLIPVLLVIAFVGSWLGKQILKKISVQNFRKMVLILLFVIGVIQIIRLL
jgi:uncharacterized membrane protein YfcA